MDLATRKRVAALRLNNALGDGTKEVNRTITRPGVSLRTTSANSKISRLTSELDRKGRRRPKPVPPYVAATYVSIGATCPDSCFFKDNGCYPQTGFTAWLMKKLDRAADEMQIDGGQVITYEAELLEETVLPRDGARGGRDLRLHVSGDVYDPESTRRLALAAERWRRHGGGQVWTYTHRWRAHRPSDFGEIEVLASCDERRDVEEAMDMGWAPAVVVPSFPSERVFKMAGGSFIPCPAQTRKVPCIDCRLCFNTERLRKMGMGIAFEVHGRHARKIHLPLAPSGSQSGGS